MIIQQLAYMCGAEKGGKAEKAAKATDWIVAIALLVIGSLAAAGVFSMSPALAYGFIGAGIVYTIVQLLRTSLDCKFEAKARID